MSNSLFKLACDKSNKELEAMVSQAIKRCAAKKRRAARKIYKKAGPDPLFIDLIQQEIARKKKLKKHGTAVNYQAALRSFSKFVGKRRVTAESLDAELIEYYEAWMSSRGLSDNSTSFYMRILRCVYNRAVKAGLTLDCKPFAYVYTGVDKTRKRAITAADLKRIKNLELSGSPALERARDMFLLSFYCIGMAFVDMAWLKKSDVRNGRLTYRRMKTGQQISMALNEKMTDMFRKYPAEENSPFLLNILPYPCKDLRKRYRTVLNEQNRYLKRIGGLVGLTTPLTTYVSRHSWASIAHSMNIRVSTISEALGHDNEETTRIYLSTVDTGSVDRANAAVLRRL